MRLSALNNFFSGTLPALELKALIYNEVKEYKRKLLKQGGSVPVYLVDDDVLNVTQKDLCVLFDAFRESKIDGYDICYISDALQMSEKVSFSNESIREKLESLTDSEINPSELSILSVSKIIKS